MSKEVALYEAVRKGSLEAVENFLSEPGHDVNKMQESGQETLLGAAAKQGSVALVDLLVDHGANVDMGTPNKTPLHIACYSGNLRLVKCLVGRGADMEVPDETNRTALQWAARGGHADIVNFLAEQKASLGRVACDGNTLLHDAVVRCESDFIFELIEKDVCQLDTQTVAGETVLFLAAASGKVDVMRKLIALGAKTDVVSKNSETLLHVASRHGHINVIEFLVETLGMDDKHINQQTGEQSFATIKKIKTPTEMWSALHFACAFGHTDVVRYLLGHGANRSQRTRDGLRAIEICKAYRQKHLLPIFEERRASHMPEEEMPSEEKLRMRRKTMPAGNPEWKYF